MFIFCWLFWDRAQNMLISQNSFFLSSCEIISKLHCNQISNCQDFGVIFKAIGHSFKMVSKTFFFLWTLTLTVPVDMMGHIFLYVIYNLLPWISAYIQLTENVWGHCMASVHTFPVHFQCVRSCLDVWIHRFTCHTHTSHTPPPPSQYQNIFENETCKRRFNMKNLTTLFTLYLFLFLFQFFFFLNFHFCTQLLTSLQP